MKGQHIPNFADEAKMHKNPAQTGGLHATGDLAIHSGCPRASKNRRSQKGRALSGEMQSIDTARAAIQSKGPLVKDPTPRAPRNLAETIWRAKAGEGQG